MSPDKSTPKKVSAISALIEKIESFDVSAASMASLEKYMGAEKVLAGFTKKVKEELLKRLLDGETSDTLTVASRNSIKLTNPAEAVKTLLAKGFSEDELYTKTLLPVKQLQALIGAKAFNDIKVDVHVTEYVKRKAVAKS